MNSNGASNADSESLDKRSLFKIWESLAEDNPEGRFINVAPQHEPRVLKYNFAAFQKRAVRHAVAIQKVLKLEPGDKIAVCVDDLSDFALLVHGAFLAHCVIIPIPRSATTEELKLILKATKPKLFVFPSSFSASVSELFPIAPYVKRWIVTGKGVEGGGASAIGPGKAIQRLEQVVLSIAGEEFDIPQVDEKVPCGAVFSPSGRFRSASSSVFFTREQILMKAQLAARVLSSSTKSGSFWTSASEFSPSGFLFNFFVPLFLGTPALIRPGFDERDFWRQLLADDVRLAVINVHQLERLERKGKQRDWRKPDDFKVLVSDQARLDETVLSGFIERFRTPVGVGFFSFALAEYVSVRSPQEEDLKLMRGEGDEALPTYGRLLGEATVAPSQLKGLKTKSRYNWGDLQVKSVLGGPTVKTGIRAALVEEPEGLELYVVGRTKNLVVRKSRLINLARIDTLVAQMQGVVYAKCVSYPHDEYGHDFLLYVLPHRLAQMNKYDVELYLAEFFEREDLPSTIILEESGGVAPPKSESELRARVGKPEKS